MAETGAPEQTSALSNLQADVARKVFALIKQGRWGVKERISETALARELSVSRTPVRQALQLFLSQGLIEHSATRGFQLARDPREVSMEDVIGESETETLYNQFMEARAAGRIGEEVSEAELLEQFSTTRGAVRRTLMRMSMEGLVSRRAGHGWQFVECLVSKEAVDESYEFRLIIECNALLVPGYAPKRDQLQALIREQEAMLTRPIQEISRTEWFSINARFHESIVAWSNNRFLTQSLERQNSLRRMTELSDFSHLSEPRLRESAQEHLTILRTIEAGDYNFASALLRRHLSRASSVSFDEPSE
ncbi:GntR family transcriptional regulator [Rhizobiaceae bacterium BDR2-2]|uniref:GntR family transcriptional regulator n=1 Tax=Ectorhizobium quercum TaxID=2965071 RepID=A0AAE3STF6_9HYPH|nr:GntR family transcriptional regulator [Ectorhizobium quercum]MCX8995902.1 GntR family transcriptional regulator [Ectorhizobium quercum]